MFFLPCSTTFLATSLSTSRLEENNLMSMGRLDAGDDLHWPSFWKVKLGWRASRRTCPVKITTAAFLVDALQLWLICAWTLDSRRTSRWRWPRCWGLAQDERQGVEELLPELAVRHDDPADHLKTSLWKIFSIIFQAVKIIPGSRRPRRRPVPSAGSSRRRSPAGLLPSATSGHQESRGSARARQEGLWSRPSRGRTPGRRGISALRSEVST